MTRLSLPSAISVPAPVGVKNAADAGAGGAHPLREGALRHELDLDFLLQVLPLEFLVLADVGRDHLA